jgi:FAD/FMN-containing dehydrogenase/uncharacterized membrane protein YhaH (DUF805 family)
MPTDLMPLPERSTIHSDVACKAKDGGFRNKLPVTYLLFTTRGRITRADYGHAVVLIACSFYILYTLLFRFAGPFSTWVIYPPFYWCVWATSCKRLHDVDKSGWWLFVILLPVLGPLYLAFHLFLRLGRREDNRFGSSPRAKVDYRKNDEGVVHPGGEGWIINDVTLLNPIAVAHIERPASVDELVEIVRTTTGPISVGGGRFSMGGQTASPGSLHIDMRGLDRVLDFNAAEKWIRVQAGIRWCDIQRQVDPHDLSVKIMQTYANFTVGGALSVNCHGRYVGLGPVILSVRWIRVLLMDGSLVRASVSENPEIFFGSIGCYNAIGIIVEAELDLADNVAVKLVQKKLTRKDYPAFFRESVRGHSDAIFHNADMYPPDFTRLRSVTFVATQEKPTVNTRLMPLRESYPVHRYFLWSFMETPFGAWRRENLIEPLLYLRPKIHWKNYEAGYDVMELEPASREKRTWVLLEYFVPVARFEEYSRRMAEIFMRHRVKVFNVSVRHAMADPGSYLAWAREEVFAFVVYYKQGTSEVEKGPVAVWTRELIDAAIACGGTYYLPYQPHATPEQFHRAYPCAQKLFALKDRLDPEFRLRNVLWNKYYQPKKART